MIPPSVRLRRALELRSLTLVRRIILSNKDIRDLICNHDPSDHGNTSLHIAAKKGLADIAEFLILQGHEDDGVSRNLEGLTPLMIATQLDGEENAATIAGRNDVARLLIEHYPEYVSIKDKDGMDAFHHACRNGSTTIIEQLLMLPPPKSDGDDKEDTNSTRSSSRAASPAPSATPTQASNPNSFPLPPRTSSKTNPMATPVDTKPPPFPSTRSRSTSRATPVHPFILSTDNAGSTPLHHASAFGHLKAVRLLVASGADPMARNSYSWTPLDYSFSVEAEVYLKSLMRDQDALKTPVGPSSPAVNVNRPPTRESPLRSRTASDVQSGQQSRREYHALPIATSEDRERTRERERDRSDRAPESFPFPAATSSAAVPMGPPPRPFATPTAEPFSQHFSQPSAAQHHHQPPQQHPPQSQPRSEAAQVRFAPSRDREVPISRDTPPSQLGHAQQSTSPDLQRRPPNVTRRSDDGFVGPSRSRNYIGPGQNRTFMRASPANASGSDTSGHRRAQGSTASQETVGVSSVVSGRGDMSRPRGGVRLVQSEDDDSSDLSEEEQSGSVKRARAAT